ncbi:MAG: TetR/AcrR family transcriptional regulator [Muribaculaceae bacterium]|nr:TetR/AcrR family transcriptional regulator [Muribaculaceae bacterium]
MNNSTTDNTFQDTEQAILMAAEKEFLSKGFAGARTTSIAEAAGVTHAMLHYYFRTKAKLFDRVLSEKIRLLKEALFSSFDYANASLEEIIKTIVERHLDFIAANPELPRFIIEEIYNDQERSSIFIEQLSKYAPLMIGAIQAKIDEAAAEGKCRKLDARMLMLDIASLNIFSFMAAPVVKAALGDLSADPKAFLAMRKKENYDTIMRKIKLLNFREF